MWVQSNYKKIDQILNIFDGTIKAIFSFNPRVRNVVNHGGFLF